MKYSKFDIVFKEHPNHVSLAFQITGCKNRCIGCHSPELQEDIGSELTETVLKNILIKYHGLVDNVIFFGGYHDYPTLLSLLKICKDNNFKTTLWTGCETVSDEIKAFLDYLKIGPYIKERGTLGSKDSNQKYFEVKTNKEIVINDY